MMANLIVMGSISVMMVHSKKDNGIMASKKEKEFIPM